VPRLEAQASKLQLIYIKGLGFLLIPPERLRDRRKASNGLAVVIVRYVLTP
jgi:hypothetical protein